MIEIIEVVTKKQRKEFVEYPLRLYKGNPYFVPPLYGDEMKLFTKKNIYFHTCRSVFYLARRDGKTVGRIQGIVQNSYNDLHGAKQARFSRFDCEDNAETARALLEAVEAWARSQQLTELVGPLGYSDLEREGLLIEGFEYLSTFEEQYNYPYYAALIEGCGYQKDVDWVESRLFSMTKDGERIRKLGLRALERYHLHIAGEGLSKNAFIKKYAKGIFACIDECYRELYGTVPFTEEMQRQMISQFKLLLSTKYLKAVCDENENVVAFGLCIPAIGEALQRSGGRLTLPTIVRVLRAVRRPKSVDLGLVGILPQYRRSGLSAFILTILQDMLENDGLDYLETNLNLESNESIQSMWKYFDCIHHKRRRSYAKSL